MMWDTVAQLCVTAVSLYAYYVLTDPAKKKIGLWLMFFAEFGWLGVFLQAKMWGMIPACVVYLSITSHRLKQLYDTERRTKDLNNV